MTAAITLFKLTFHTFQLIFKLFGLIPPIRQSKSPLNLIIYYAYSITFVSVIIYYYKDWSSVASSSINNGLITNLTIFYSNSLNITSLSLLSSVYIIQHLNLYKKLQFEKRSKTFFKHFNKTFCLTSKNYPKTEIIIFVAIVVITNVPYTIALFVKNFNRTNNVFLAIIYVLPSEIPTLLTDFFCGYMLVSGFYFKQLNEKLLVIVKVIIDIIGKIKTTKKYQFMKEFYDLSDQLDEVAFNRKVLTSLTLEFNRLWSKWIMIYLCWRFYLLAAQLYINFVLIKIMIIYWQISMFNIFYSFILIFTDAFSMIKISYCCWRVIKEVSCIKNRYILYIYIRKQFFKRNSIHLNLKFISE